MFVEEEKKLRAPRRHLVIPEVDNETKSDFRLRINWKYLKFKYWCIVLVHHAPNYSSASEK